ncbi:MAG TPA: trypsin-like peptidase domain-containing protein [Thermoanaerobaculia bacterium]|nr:trypsin-like peptidase domain-containing protein [Thermoanaerobaculia bacterium]
MKRALPALLILGAAGIAAAAPLPSRRSEIVEVVDKVSPAVVNIAAEQTVRRRPSILDDFFFGIDPRSRRAQQSLGSGVIIRPEGIILTNDHVISGASRILATMKNGQELECDVVGSDADNDLAVLRVRTPRGNLPTIRLGTSSDLMIGETVVAIGNPFGLSNTVTTGVLSALGRSVPGENQRMYTDFVQIDAPINPGNSGGPVVNIQGDMIGVATAIIGGAQGIGFAIPVDRAKRIVDDLLRFGEVRAVWIGVRGQTLTSGNAELARPGGFRVRSVTPGSPAARAGLRPGDLIVSVDGAAIVSREAFETALSTRGPGRPMRLVLRGSNGERTVTVQGQAPPADLGVRILREQLGITLSRARGGLQINVVDRNGDAADRGIESGDLLLGLNGAAVRSLDDVNRILQRDFNRTTLLMEVGRGRFAYTLTFPLD